MKLTISLALLVLFVTIGTDAQQQLTRRTRIRQQQRPAIIQPESEELSSDEIVQPVIQYYRPQAKQDNADELVYVNEEEFQNLYAQQQRQQQVAPRRQPQVAVSTVRPIARHNPPPAALSPRSKTAEPAEKVPPVQTIRNYNKVNDDGSFTFGYEAADGSFKEETRGTDCVVRGRYGYVDPEGNKREFTYVSGNPCDPNNPDGSDEDDKSEEELDDNTPQNYPKRPLPAPRPAAAPRPRPAIPATTRAPTTVFSSNFNPQDASDEEDDGRIQYAQIPRTTARPNYAQPTRRPSVQNTPQPPATTYRPQTIVTQKPALASTPSYVSRPQTVSFGSPSTRGGGGGGQIDFDAEFKKFQSETGFSPVTPSGAPTTKTVKGSASSGGNPIYSTQLVFNPATGQYDSNLYQAIAQTNDEFQLNQRIQPYVHQQQQQQYQPPQAQAQPQAPQQQTFFRPSPQIRQVPVPQQVYQRQQNDLQFLNSQQLFAQQVQQQQSQLQRERTESAKRLSAQQQAGHRFQLAQSEPQPILRTAPGGQQYYYVQQPSQRQSGGQIEAFLRGHNLEY